YIKIDGSNAGKRISFDFYYNIFTKKFYSDVGPEFYTLLGPNTYTSQESGRFEASRGFNTRKQQIEKWLVIDLTQGTKYSDKVVHIRLAADKDTGTIAAIGFAQNDSPLPDILKPLRPLINRVTTLAGQVIVTEDCS